MMRVSRKAFSILRQFANEIDEPGEMLWKPFQLIQKSIELEGLRGIAYPTRNRGDLGHDVQIFTIATDFVTLVLAVKEGSPEFRIFQVLLPGNPFHLGRAVNDYGDSGFANESWE